MLSKIAKMNIKLEDIIDEKFEALDSRYKNILDFLDTYYSESNLANE